MKAYVLTGAATLALTTSGAFAAGLDRSGQSVGAIFAADNSASTSFGIVMPSVTGKDSSGTGTGSYDVGETYTQFGMSFTNAVNDRFNYSVILDQPFGADVSYGGNPLTGNLSGTSADLNSTAINFVGRYKIGDRFSIFGGVAAQRINAQVNLNGLAYANAIPTAGVAKGFNARIAGTGLPELDATALGTAAAQAAAGNFSGVAAINATYAASGSATQGTTLVNTLTTAITDFKTNDGYKFTLENSTRPSYFIGAAYEIPDIALRIAGTYRFETTHNADTSESVNGTTTPGTIEFKTPRSFNLEAQTGVAPGTLVTFGYRWTEFSSVDLVPTVLGSDLVNIDDTERYTLGVVRQFSDKLVASATLSYEPEGDKLVSPLGPTNGLFGVSLGGRYTHGNMNISGGINYSKVGDAIAEVADAGVTSFSDNHVVGVGFKIDFTF